MLARRPRAQVTGHVRPRRQRVLAGSSGSRPGRSRSSRPGRCPEPAVPSARRAEAPWSPPAGKPRGLPDCPSPRAQDLSRPRPEAASARLRSAPANPAAVVFGVAALSRAGFGRAWVMVRSLEIPAPQAPRFALFLRELCVPNPIAHSTAASSATPAVCRPAVRSCRPTPRPEPIHPCRRC